MNFKELIALAIDEDIKEGDHTTNACIPSGAKEKAHLLIKQDGVLAGMQIAEEVFKQIDSNLLFEPKMVDGNSIKKGDVAFHLKGASQSILKGERLALNFMQRMSGIATHTANLNKLIEDLPTKLLDTRKTTPNFRFFEKEAVKIGGGYNHRIGLYDMIMIKDNHIDYAGGIRKAIDKTAEYLIENKLNLKVEIEARNLNEVREILHSSKVDRIMLDNFSFPDLKEAVQLIGDSAETEASGGIDASSLRDYALCGVDFISVGALTHQIQSLDMSLKAVIHG